MLDKFTATNETDSNSNPTGGSVNGVGLVIRWQDGPLKDAYDKSTKPNGAFVETVIAACLQRLEFYQDSKFAYAENASAIYSLKDALFILEQRVARGVEGKHEV